MFRLFHRFCAAVLLLLCLAPNLSAAGPVFVDLSFWTPIVYGRFEQGPGNWVLSQNNTVVTQTRNSDPSILVSDFTMSQHRIAGTWRINDRSDDDFVGFVFGLQDETHYYLFDWKQVRQFTPRRGTAEAGMTLKVVNAGTPINRADLWPTFSVNTNRVRTLYHNEIPWESHTDYRWQLDFVPGFLSIRVTQDTNILDVIQVAIDDYPVGKFGFYNQSQEDVIYSQFVLESLPPWPTMSISDAEVIEGDDGSTNMVFDATLSFASAEPVRALVATRAVSATDGADFTGMTNSLIEFPPGTTNLAINVPVLGDFEVEDDETFTIHLYWLENSTFGKIDGLGTIIDNEERTNEPPVVEITQPANGTIFNTLAPIAIDALATDSDGNVVQVDFYSGSQLIGQLTNAPFGINLQPDAIGDYTLTAVATDDDGDTGISLPVVIGVRSGTNADVAIVRNFADDEITLMRQYLAEMGYTSLVFDQDGLTFDLLDDFRLVIWDDLGEVEEGLSNNDVTVFKQLADADMPLYFIGEHLGSSAGNLDELGKFNWRGLSHILSFPVSSGNGFVTATANSHPVSNGPFGTVIGFPHPPTMDPARRINDGSQLVGFSGETDVVLAFETPGGVRTVTQNVLVSKTAPECGLIEREKMFKNAVWWLLREPEPPLFLNLWADIEVSHTRVVAGTPVTFTVYANHSGELGAPDTVLVNHLPEGMTLVDANASQGTCTNVCGLIICELGELAYSYYVAVTITAIPSQAGFMTNVATLSARDPEPRIVDNTISTIVEVVDPVDVEMALHAERIATNEIKLQLTAPEGLRYLIESSGDMENWELFEDFVSADEVTCFTNAISPLAVGRFYRARLHTP